MRTSPQIAMFSEERLSLDRALELTAESLNLYGPHYEHWAIAYSGGKDSSATVAATLYLIERGQVMRPKSITVLYADTRMELTPLHIAAMSMLEHLQSIGIKTQIVLPEMDDRYFVYMFGRGVPPPSNTFRWCTAQLKIEPMERALLRLRDEAGQKFLMLTGVRVGESAARDQRIAVSCSKNGAECGQGWFQTATPESVADTLAPILHWRECLVWDFLMMSKTGVSHGFPTAAVAQAYTSPDATEEACRTGCVGCNLASRDVALERVIKWPNWAYLSPLMDLRPLYAELKKPANRLRHSEERLASGELSSNPQRMGPLTMDARRMGLAEILRIQDAVNAHRGDNPPMTLIDEEEHARIMALIAADTWPRGWTGKEPVADQPLPVHIGKGGTRQFVMDILRASE